MIVSEVMTTQLVTVAPDDTLAHAANLFRQYQFHHLPVVRTLRASGTAQPPVMALEGLLTSHDIELAAARETQNTSLVLLRPWQEQRVVEVMHTAAIRVTPTTSAAAAAQLLVERGLNCLPVVEYEQSPEVQSMWEGEIGAPASNAAPILVGLLTRSDLLMALARSLGAFEPGVQLIISLPLGDLTPLAQTLLLAAELHVRVRSVMAAPLEGGVPQVATVRLGTINPAPLLARLREAKVIYRFAEPGENMGTPTLEGD